MADELGDQYWQFDVASIARMLSPKLLQDEGFKQHPCPPLSSFTSLVDDDAVWPNLKFFEYDRQTKDGIEGAAPLKPDLIAGSGSNLCGKPAGYWSMPQNPVDGGMEIRLAVEVKDNCNKIVTQAGTYPRAQVSAKPLRLFSLVVGVNHKTRKSRFLIYHRGGLTASREIEIDKEGGRREVQQILFSILLWQKPEDAGFPPFTNGVNFYIPSGSDLSFTHILTNEVLFHSLAVRGRGTLVVRGLSKESAGPSLVPKLQVRNTIPGSARTQRETRRKLRTQPMETSHSATTTEPEETQPMETSHDETTIEPITAIKPTQYYPDLPHYTCPPNMIGPSGVIPSSGGMVVKFSYPNSEKRQIEAKMYEACSGQFGLPHHLVSFEACRLDGAAFSNSIFLPPKSDDAIMLASYRWYPMTAKSQVDPSPPDYRSLWVTVTADEGKSLEHCSGPEELVECLLDVLIGWVALMKIGGRGYLHRDVTIGNIVKLETPVHRPPFSMKAAALELYKTHHADDSEIITHGLANMHLEGDKFWAPLRSKVAKHDKGLEKVIIASERLDKVLAELGPRTKCRALLIDGDMAADLESYFTTSKHACVISGTPEFMSRSLREALEDNDKDYIQNPVDDLHSFMWTALWATVYNRRALEGAGEKQVFRLQKWREGLSDDEILRREGVLRDVTSSAVVNIPGHSPFLKGMSPLIRDWEKSIDSLTDDFTLAFSAGKHTQSEQKLYMFYQYALEGVADYAELLFKWRERLQSTM